MFRIADKGPTKLHYVQNRLAHVVIKSPTVTRSVALRLPLKFRIDFKICLLANKTLCEKQAVICRPRFSYNSHSTQLDHTRESTYLSSRKRPKQAQGHFIVVSFLSLFPKEQPPTISLFGSFSCNSQKLWFGLFSINTSMPASQLMSWITFMILPLDTDFAVAPLGLRYLWYGSLTDWLIDWYRHILIWVLVFQLCEDQSRLGAKIQSTHFLVQSLPPSSLGMDVSCQPLNYRSSIYMFHLLHHWEYYHLSLIYGTTEMTWYLRGFQSHSCTSKCQRKPWRHCMRH